VFFDALGVRWYYEYEGYPLKSGWYLPDFWLPDTHAQVYGTVSTGCWVEIKPKAPSELEKTRCSELAQALGQPVFCFDKPPGGDDFLGWDNAGCEDQGMKPSACNSCGEVSIVYLGMVERLNHCSGCGGHKTIKHADGYGHCSGQYCAQCNPKLVRAADAACRYSFWKQPKATRRKKRVVSEREAAVAACWKEQLAKARAQIIQDSKDYAAGKRW
jgi:hypothetical protein